jgi:hypothetical protein
VDNDILKRASEALNQAWDEETRGKPRPMFDFGGFLLPIVISLIQSCLGGLIPKTPGQVAQFAQRGGLLARIAVRRRIAQAMAEKFGPGAFGRHGGPAMVESVLRAARQVTEEDVKALAAVPL